MLDRAQIAPLLPHQGASLLLDGVLSWSAQQIACCATSHLDLGNPLRRAGALAMLCGAEYGMQAAALHGALTSEVPQRAGFVAALRDLTLASGRLDDVAHGRLRIDAVRESSGAGGSIYAIRLAAADGAILLMGRATVAFMAAALP